MIAPDSDAESQPEGVAIPPEALAAGQRTLAAIIFTDTVGFSALMSKDEEKTLRLVARDLDQMKSLCVSFGGQVLKSTGDGLLMLFTSAVQAVACALEIQRTIQKQNLELPKAEQLRHRIGIHLGDVFQQGGDVMGDGVNIAARLQTQAVPGGICLSKTVYDVVQNRLQFYVNDLGARKLKNIGMVTAYQISPTEGGAGQGVAWYRWRPWIWRGVWALAALVILLIVYGLGMQHQHQLHLAVQHKPATNEAPVAVTPVPTNPVAPGPELTKASGLEFEAADFSYMQKYDFGGMQMWIQTHEWPGKATSKLSDTCTQLAHLFNWSYQQLQKYSEQNPLMVTGKFRTIAYWPGPFGGLNMKVEGRVRSMSRDQVTPLAMLGLMNELIKEDGTPGDVQTLELQRQTQLFARVYKIEFLNKMSGPATGVQTTNAPANP
jgi:class 3 adenylate cyclase